MCTSQSKVQKSQRITLEILIMRARVAAAYLLAAFIMFMEADRAQIVTSPHAAVA